MNSKLPWDDLRFVLAIAEAGTLAGAGRRLGTSHATVFRRLGDVERRLGVRLFERSRTGYAPTDAGDELADAARRVEVEIHDAERRIVGRDLRPVGIVRVTTTDSLMAGLVSPILAAFRRQYPGIVLEVAVSNQVFSLTKREADVAIRSAAAPPETLVGRRVATLAQAVYDRRDAAGDGTAGNTTAAGDSAWIGPDERMHYPVLEAWMAARGLADLCGCRVDSVLGMTAAVRDGLGRAVLPCYIGDREPALARVGDPLPELAADLWLLTHADVRASARIRAFTDFAAVRIRAAKDLLAGARPADHSAAAGP